MRSPLTIIAFGRSCRIAVNALSNSSGFVTATDCSVRFSDRAAALVARSYTRFAGLLAFHRSASFDRRGKSSLSSASRFVAVSGPRGEDPVTFPPRSGQALNQPDADGITRGDHDH